MPTPSKRFADLASLKTLFAGMKAKYEPKDAAIVKDASYVHTDENYTTAEKTKLASVASGANATSAGTGLSMSESTINHSNSVTAQTTQALYPMTIDAQGHVSSYGTAVTPLDEPSVTSCVEIAFGEYVVALPDEG